MRALFLIVLLIISDESKAKRKWALKKLQNTVEEMEDRILHIEEDVREIKSLPVFNATKSGVLDLESANNEPTKWNSTESKNRSKNRRIFRRRFKPRGYRKTYTYESTMAPIMTSLPWKQTRDQSLNKHGPQKGRMNFDMVTRPTPLLSSLPWQGFIDGAVSTGTSRNVHRGWRRQHSRSDHDLDSEKPRGDFDSGKLSDGFDKGKPSDDFDSANTSDDFDPGNFSSGSVDSHPKKTMDKKGNMLSMLNRIFKHGGAGHDNLIKEVLKHVNISSTGTGHNQNMILSHTQGKSTIHFTARHGRPPTSKSTRHGIYKRKRFFQPIDISQNRNKTTPMSHRFPNRQENPATLTAKKNGMVNSLGTSPPERMNHGETKRHQHPSSPNGINHGIVARGVLPSGRLPIRRNVNASVYQRDLFSRTISPQSRSQNGRNMTAPKSHRGATSLHRPSLHSLSHRSGMRMSNPGNINNGRNMTGPKSHRGASSLHRPSLHSLVHRSGMRMSNPRKINNGRNMTAPKSHRGATSLHRPSLHSLVHRSGMRMSNPRKINNGRNMTAPKSHRGATSLHRPSLHSLAHPGMFSSKRMSHPGKNNNRRNMTSSLPHSLFRFGLQPLRRGKGARILPAGMNKLVNTAMFK